ncbi:hypothetical protein AX16_001287 [Volvariella volvacea WC 439]|nr:hypothetical protein AX16_001287 [Volvariella volvacea WC 439]
MPPMQYPVGTYSAQDDNREDEVHWLKRVMSHWDAAESDLVAMLEELDLFLGLSQPSSFAVVRKAREAISKYQRLKTRREQDKKTIKTLIDRLEKLDRMHQADTATGKAVEESLLAQIQKLEGQMLEKDSDIARLQKQLLAYKNNTNPLPVPPEPAKLESSTSNNYSRVVDAISTGRLFEMPVPSAGPSTSASTGTPYAGIYANYPGVALSESTGKSRNSGENVENGDTPSKKDRKGKGKEKERDGGHRSREHREKREKGKDKDKEKGRQPYSIYREPDGPVGFIPPPSSSLVQSASNAASTSQPQASSQPATAPAAANKSGIIPGPTSRIPTTADDDVDEPSTTYVFNDVGITPEWAKVQLPSHPPTPLQDLPDVLREYLNARGFDIMKVHPKDLINEDGTLKFVPLPPKTSESTAADSAVPGPSTQKQARTEDAAPAATAGRAPTGVVSQPGVGSSSTYISAQPVPYPPHASTSSQPHHSHHHHKSSKRKSALHASLRVDGHMSEGGELLNSSIRQRLATHQLPHQHQSHQQHSHHHHHRSRRHSNATREAVPTRPPPPYEPFQGSGGTTSGSTGYPVFSGHPGYPASVQPQNQAHTGTQPATAAPAALATSAAPPSTSSIINDTTTALAVAAAANLINGNPSNLSSSSLLSSSSSSSAVPHPSIPANPNSSSSSLSALTLAGSSSASLPGLNNGLNDVNAHNYPVYPLGFVPSSSSSLAASSTSSLAMHQHHPGPSLQNTSANERDRERGDRSGSAGRGSGLGLGVGTSTGTGTSLGNTDRGRNTTVQSQLQQYQQFHLQQQQQQRAESQANPERWSGSSWGTVNTLTGEGGNRDANGSTSTLGWLPLRSFPVAAAAGVAMSEPVNVGRGQEQSQARGRDRRSRGNSSRGSGSGSGSGAFGPGPSFPLHENSDEEMPTGVRSAVTGAPHSASIYGTMRGSGRGAGYGGTTPADGVPLRQRERRMSSPTRRRNVDLNASLSSLSSAPGYQHSNSGSSSASVNGPPNHPSALFGSQHRYQPQHHQQGSTSSVGSSLGLGTGFAGFGPGYDPRTPRASISNSSHSNDDSSNSLALMIHPTSSSTAPTALVRQGLGEPTNDSDDESTQSQPQAHRPRLQIQTSSSPILEERRSPPAHLVPNRRNAPVRLPSSASIASTIDLGSWNRESRASGSALGLGLELSTLVIEESQEPSSGNALGLDWDLSSSDATVGHGSGHGSNSRDGSLRGRGTGAGATQGGQDYLTVVAPTPIVSSRSFLRSWSGETSN